MQAEAILHEPYNPNSEILTHVINPNAEKMMGSLNRTKPLFHLICAVYLKEKDISCFSILLQFLLKKTC